MSEEIMDTKICEVCHKEKPLNKFRLWKRKGGLFGSSKECRQCLDKAFYVANTTAKPRNKPFYDEIQKELVKLCKPCNTIKPIKDFKMQKGLPTYCKPCWNKSQKSVKKRRVVSGKDKKYRNNLYSSNQDFRAKTLARNKKRRNSMTDEQRNSHNKKAYQYLLVRRARKKGSTIVIVFTKADIIKRDGLNCYLCGETLTEKTAEIEHILPLSRGGSHKLENVKIACGSCNRSKSNKTLTEYKKWRGDYLRFDKCQSSQNLHLYE